ncbi:MAG: hypothetical protein G8D81_19065 [gamma proteobacterium symbiont of Clathrolucina costata]
MTHLLARIDLPQTPECQIVVLCALETFTHSAHLLHQGTLVDAEVTDHVVGAHQIRIEIRLEVVVESHLFVIQLVFIGVNNLSMRIENDLLGHKIECKVSQLIIVIHQGNIIPACHGKDGTLIDGSIFDSSRQRGKPARFGLDKVVPGFREALLLMKPGAKWKIVIPPELAYGERGAGKKIGPNETIIFELELIKVAAKPKSTKQ